MKVLFDHCVPKRLRRHLTGHEVKTTYEMGWAAYKNGALLAVAEAAFPVFLTVDQNLAYQQNLTGRALAILILVVPTNRLEDLIPLVPEAERALQSIQPGTVVLVPSPEGTQ